MYPCKTVPHIVPKNKPKRYGTIIFLFSMIDMYPRRPGIAMATDEKLASHMEPEDTAKIQTTYMMSIRNPRQKTFRYCSKNSFQMVPPGGVEPQHTKRS